MLWSIVKYDGGRVWEPAEGGYYVPITYVSGESKEKYKWKHAQREFRKAIRNYTEYYGEPEFVTTYRAYWRTGKYIGDEVELRLETVVGRHEEKYYGYC